MNKVFPELKRVRGHFICPYKGKSEHWWLKNNNKIIDPTRSQFAYYSDEQYEEIDETKEQPTGKCHVCGDYCYKDRYTCSEYCSKVLMDDLKCT